MTARSHPTGDERPDAPQRQPQFRHLDDVPWQKVRAQRNADGVEVFVHEKWMAYSPAPQYLSLYARYDPGMIVRRHGHRSPHVVFVLEGDCWIGDRHCRPGTHVELPLGAAFGPIVAGDKGVVMFEVMMGDPSSWGDQPELFDAALAERGATALPHPPIEIPTNAVIDQPRHRARAASGRPENGESAGPASDPALES